MGIAMTIPFQIDATGGVAATDNERKQLLDRVDALVATLPGERVMRATYGVPTTQLLFAPSPESADAQLRQMVMSAVQQWEPSAVVTRVVSKTNENLGLVDVTVEVSRADIPGSETPNTRIVTVTMGGTVSDSPR